MQTRPSRLEEAENGCPRRVKYDPRPDTEHTVYGTAVHAAIERWREPPHDMDGVVIDPYDMLDAWDDICCRDVFKGIREGEDTVNNLSLAKRQQGIKDLGHWQKEEEPVRPDILATEWKFSMQLGDHTVVGTCDAIDREGSTLVVADNKTGFGQYDAKTSLQIACYGIAAANAWEWEGPIRLEFRLITQGYRRWHYTNRHKLMTEVAPAIITLINSMEAREESGIFPEFLNQYCPFCSLRNDCDTFGKMALSPLDPEKALEQWKEAKLLEGLAKKRAKELAPGAMKGMGTAKNRNGVVRKEKSSRTVDVGRLVKKIPLEDLFEAEVIRTVSVTALDELVKKKPELANDVYDCVSHSKTEYLQRTGKKK